MRRVMKKSMMTKVMKKPQSCAFLFYILLPALAAGYGSCSSGPPVPAGWGDPALVELSGTGVGTALGYGGDITITLTVENGMILDVRIEAPGETPSIGTPAIARSRRAMLRKNSMDIDAISGATITCIAIKTATQAALDQIIASNKKN
jgi:fumarate reductase flavoprotein subunit